MLQVPGAPSTPLASWHWHAGTPEERLIYWLCVGLNAMFLLAFAILVSGVSAPYGRYNQADAKRNSNPIMRVLAACDINARVAWVLQECPTLIAAAVCWSTGDPACRASLGNILVLLCFIVHYVNRAIVYPLRIKGSKPIPLPVMLMAASFCAANGYIQCRSLMRLVVVPARSVTLPVGLALWAAGLYINTDADCILRNLRKPGETGYKIPYGGMFEYVSGANFFGEILEWMGFALAMGCALPGVTFALCTACNIGPRAMAHHRWYLEKFPEQYPRQRRALVPFVL